MNLGSGIASAGIAIGVGLAVGGWLLGGGIGTIRTIKYGLSDIGHSLHTLAMEYRDAQKKESADKA